MPSARIITHVVEDAYPLAEDLRMRGFVVQIVSTDRPRAVEELAPVDLEITLEDCEPEAALRLADHIPDGDDLSVFVAPGALTDGPRPIRVMSLIPEIPAITLPAPAVSPTLPPIEAREAPAPAAPAPIPLLEEPVVEPANEEVAAAALSSLMTEDTAEIPAITLPAPAVSPTLPPIEAREAPAPAAPAPIPLLEEPVVEPANEEVAAAALSSLMTEDTAEIPAITLPAPAVSPALPPIEAREAPAPAAPAPIPLLEEPVVEPANEEVAAAALSSLMTEDTAAAAPAGEQPMFLASRTVGALQTAKPLEKTPRTVPVALFARMAYQALAFQARSWTERVRADERLLLKCATLAAMGAVVGISVLVLGSTAHRLDPLSPAIHSATDSVLLPAAASAPAPRNPAPQAAQTATEAKRPTIHKVAPAPAAPARVAHSSHHPPEEDIVARDFVVRYGSRPPAKKSVETKRYSDLN